MKVKDQEVKVMYVMVYMIVQVPYMLMRVVVVNYLETYALFISHVKISL
jgi:hypothetical protein